VSGAGTPAAGAPLVVARRDPALVARVTRRVPMRYAGGADDALDRPAHVRAGSGLACLATPAGERLAVVQDDANFLALVDPATGLADAVTLPAGVGGRRQFDRGRGNKQHKLDLESCLLLDDPAHPGDAGRRALAAFGSGSTRVRERVVVVRGLADAGGAGASAVDVSVVDVAVVDASALYTALRAATDFAGAELNVEGAALVAGAPGDGAPRVRLFARGNGASPDARSATGDVDAAALAAYLLGPTPAPAPPLERVARYDLGTLGGERLGFTDAVAFGAGGVLYVAAAESSADVVEDGPVAGSALGVIDAAGRARWTPIVDAAGAPFLEKVEGVAFDGAGRLWAVVDQDDPDRPSELCALALDGADA
jgi:hypothetical protein